MKGIILVQIFFLVCLQLLGVSAVTWSAPSAAAAAAAKAKLMTAISSNIFIAALSQNPHRINVASIQEVQIGDPSTDGKGKGIVCFFKFTMSVKTNGRAATLKRFLVVERVDQGTTSIAVVHNVGVEPTDADLNAAAEEIEAPVAAGTVVVAGNSKAKEIAQFVFGTLKETGREIVRKTIEDAKAIGWVGICFGAFLLVSYGASEPLQLLVDTLLAVCGM